MIKILAKKYSQAVDFLCEKLDSELVAYDLTISRSKQTTAKTTSDAVTGNDSALIVVGNVGDACADFAEALSLVLYYDKFAESSILKYCAYANLPVPPKYVMDKLCLIPETFNHFAPVYGYQCVCYGEYNKKHIYFVPDDPRECSVAYDNYISKNLFKGQEGSVKYVFKIFGLSQKDVEARLDKLNRSVLRRCETVNLDTTLRLSFPPKTSKGVVSDTLQAVKELFGDSLYASADVSLAKRLVEVLKKVGQTMSTAESMTGGLIASSVVDVAGASSVLYEGVVTYSIASKCNRLGINPHFVDEYGVVSQQVAQAMALGLRKNGSGLAISITGNAGPTSEDGAVGLCFIGIATERGVSVYRNVFTGDRNSVRAQATNMAMYLALKTLTN